MVIIPHPPYSLDVVPCGITLFAKLKIKLKGQRFETVCDIKRESQVVFNSIKENNVHSSFEV
jgi:hypothetical protein